MSDHEEKSFADSSQASSMPASRATGLKIVLSTYDRSIDPKQWLQQLEKVKKAKNWTRPQLIAQALLLLTGRTADCWETTESTVTYWKTFKEEFSTEFCERKTVGEHFCDPTISPTKLRSHLMY